ncbi:MAG TPA: 50S ribosomal protein L13 [Candidatus Sabulitectum sp.]|nr:50S ribosomal protein L13 [Candidatus Sabulitectum sp.]HPJ29007.1 50S ribosomal protein L13 [Candidatus Sabulitectum sp.]HPR22540.1 50S ribosomal protein L13 [Candidatus Sabulitectum sp.]HRW77506.1 50S ribosomal protein L13 [Candidatus Sabulitectum sp.]
MKTYSAKAGEIKRDWWVVDASDQTLGRLSAKLAMILQGKNKPVYTPHMDTGDFVVVVNVDKMRITGRKLDQKVYYRHTGYAGGQKATTMRDMMDKHPERVLTHAVKGMLPKNRLSRAQLKKLKIFSGPEHTHAAQQPRVLEIK